MRTIQFQSLILLFLLISVFKMSESAPSIESEGKSASSVDPPAQSSDAAVHIVYTERPQDEEPEAYHLRTLSSLLGSDEAAKDALVYSYKTAASGFSARLTREQVERLSKQPGVLQIVPSRKYQLHPAKPGNLH